MACEPQELLNLARCFMCLSKKELAAVQAYLLCQINGGSGVVTCSNSEGADSPLNVITPDFVGTVDLSGGTSAAPAGQGAADVITLTGRGVTVNHN